ncbi:hypothetical protein OB905_03440 [Halobacteria archaeon AArc-dxtr1]|nr:hypothetical protein [Halobacteria archaeon AArc-dxtr1]
MRRRTLLAAGTGTLAGLSGCVGELPWNTDSDETDDSEVEIADDSGITEVDIRSASPTVSPNLEEPLALFATDATSDERPFGVTVDSQSVLVHAITWGYSSCYEIEARDVEVLDGSVHLTVRRVEDAEQLAESGCGDSMPSLALTARITFADEPPESGLCTFWGQAAELEAIDLDDFDPCTYQPTLSECDDQ